MGLFDMFKKETPKQEPTKPLATKSWIEDLGIDTGSWTEVFSACLGKMICIQNACSELVVKGQDWNVDFSKGVISFGDQNYPLQFIGSESSSSNTWLWGWENVNNFPEHIITMAQQTKTTGEQWGLEPLTTAEFDLDETFQGHSLSIVACGMLTDCCYYRGPHNGGAILVSFSGVPKEVFAPIDALTFISHTNQCIGQFELDQRIFVEALLTWNKTAYEWNDLTLTAHFKEGLQIVFEQVGEFLRIASMNTTIKGTSPS